MGLIPAGPLYRGRATYGAEAHGLKARFNISVELGLRADSSSKMGSRRHHQNQPHLILGLAGLVKWGPCRKLGLVEELAGITSNIGEAEALGLAGAGGV